ncbi:MAG: VOC family protein [Dehalococcoidales bacterium]|nr:VOC family protein [Dehalococcoidales bacterium]
MSQQSEDNSIFNNLFQIGLVVRDMDQAIERFSALGLGPFYDKTPPAGARETFRGKPFVPSQSVSIKATRPGNFELELIQPLEGESPHKEYLQSKGEGIQHIALYVDDLDQAINTLLERGCTMLLDSRETGGRIAYLDLEAAGLIVELVRK